MGSKSRAGAPELSDELCQEAALAYENANRNSAAAARALNIGRPTFQHRIARAAARGFVKDRAPVLPGFEIVHQTAVLDDSGRMVREFVSQAPAVEHVDFAVPDGHRIKGVSALVDGENRVVQQWVKTTEDALSPEAIVAHIRAALEGFEARATIADPIQHIIDEDLATVYIAADWHVGLLAYKPEVGHNYDIKIAQQTIETAMSRLVASTPPAKQAVVLGLGDLLHSDGFENTTSRSKNQLDVDGRWPLLLRTASQLMRFTINEALKKHETVLVRILPGNHDDQSSVAVAHALAMYYENEPRVTVDDNLDAFWWWSWGTVLLGATHGDQAKMKDLPLIMAARNSTAWGASKFRHIYTGHIHTQTGLELSGVTVESFQTPVATDAWHHRMGYGANRSVIAITHSKTAGEISRNRVNVL